MPIEIIGIVVTQEASESRGTFDGPPGPPGPPVTPVTPVTSVTAPSRANPT